MFNTTRGNPPVFETAQMFVDVRRVKYTSDPCVAMPAGHLNGPASFVSVPSREMRRM